MSDDDQMPPPDGRRSVTVRLPSSNGLAAVIASVIVVLLVAAVVLEGMRLHDANHDKATLKAQLNARGALGTITAGAGLSAEDQSVIATATTYAEQFSTYNYKSLDTDFGITESHALEPFLSKYKSETAQIRPDLVKLKASSSGKVLTAGVASITPTTAVVDLFLNQTISNSASSQPRVDTQRVEMTLTKQSSRWLISKVVLP